MHGQVELHNNTITGAGSTGVDINNLNMFQQTNVTLNDNVFTFAGARTSTVWAGAYIDLATSDPLVTAFVSAERNLISGVAGDPLHVMMGGQLGAGTSGSVPGMHFANNTFRDFFGVGMFIETLGDSTATVFSNDNTVSAPVSAGAQWGMVFEASQRSTMRVWNQGADLTGIDQGLVTKATDQGRIVAEHVDATIAADAVPFEVKVGPWGVAEVTAQRVTATGSGRFRFDASASTSSDQLKALVEDCESPAGFAAIAGPSSTDTNPTLRLGSWVSTPTAALHGDDGGTLAMMGNTTVGGTPIVWASGWIGSFYYSDIDRY